MWFVRLYAQLVLALFSSLAFSCEADREIWSHDARGLTTMVYFPEGRTMGFSPLIFEGWRENRIIWRVRGHVSCSNNVVMCGVSIPMTRGDGIATSADLVFDNGRIEYIVFGNLWGVSYNAQHTPTRRTMIEADWFIAKAEFEALEEPAILLPTYYRFDRCRTNGELQKGNVVVSAESQTVHKIALKGLRRGMPYQIARSVLLDGDWTAMDHSNRGPTFYCGTRTGICKAYGETESCADDGSQRCIFGFTNPRGGNISLETSGTDVKSLVLESWTAN